MVNEEFVEIKLAMASWDELCQRIDRSILHIEEQLRNEARVPKQTSPKLKLPQLDFLEISMMKDSSVCAAIRRCGGRALAL